MTSEERFRLELYRLLSAITQDSIFLIGLVNSILVLAETYIDALEQELGQMRHE